MIEFNDDIPFLWRLSSHDSDGFCVVSMVVPFNHGNESHEHTIETDVLSFASDICSTEEEELEWNEEDLNLFLKLISSRFPDSPVRTGDSIRVDLSDPDTIEIVHIVAAAGFGMALPADTILADSPWTLLPGDFEIGSQVSIHTVEGFKRCVVVDMEEEDVVCVILDPIEVQSPGQIDEINPYDLLMLKRHQILHSEYTLQAPSDASMLH